MNEDIVIPKESIEAKHAMGAARLLLRINKLENKLEAANAVVNMAIGLNLGEDWNNGTHAKIYRSKLREAIKEYKDK